MSEIKKEMVNHPEHYKGNKFEVIEIIEDYNLGFNLGNAVKYILRCEKKGKKTEDLNKAIWYLNREIYMANNPRKAAMTNITSPEERSQALKNTINSINKNICPVCGKKLENENMQVCKECEKKIPWGSFISAYSEKNHYKSFSEFYKNIERIMKENEKENNNKGKHIKCMSCGDYFLPENDDDLICENCKEKYLDENENEYKCVDNRNINRNRNKN